MKNQKGMSGAKRLLHIQIGLTAILVAAAFAISGKHAALSVLFGGMTSILPSAYFAKSLFAVQGAKKARQIVKRLYKGEAIKIVMSIVMFTVIFKCAEVIPMVFFAAYIVTQMTLWFAPLVFINKQNRPECD